jgi:hypothetical protein
MNMQTGFGDAGDTQATNYMNTMIDIMMPVMENSMVLAAEYCKACGRDVILPEDMEYASKYCAMYTVGQKIGSFFPEVYDDEESEDEVEIEEVAEEECPTFVRYSGVDPKIIQINDAYDRWDTWEPQSPAEHMLKNAINSNEHMGA